MRIQAAKGGWPGTAVPIPPFLLLLTSPLPPAAYVGNADMIQPELTPLQPSLDDFMETSGGARPSPGVEGQGQQESPRLTSGQFYAPLGGQMVRVTSEGFSWCPFVWPWGEAGVALGESRARPR